METIFVVKKDRNDNFGTQKERKNHWKFIESYFTIYYILQLIIIIIIIIYNCLYCNHQNIIVLLYCSSSSVDKIEILNTIYIDNFVFYH